jgi:phage-related protein
MNYFVFDGFRSDTAGLLVERRRSLGLPQRDVEKISIPGRSGDVLIDHGSYQNVRVAYDCAARDNAALERLKQAITAGGGYRLLTDSFSPWQRMALYASALDIEELILRRAFRFTITFDCKPQRYYDRAQAITGTTSVTITRPAGFTQSDPRIEITGTGSVTLNTPQGNIPLGALTGSAVIDSEAMVAFRNNTNGTRTAIDIPFWPRLTAASTNISATGSVTNLKIYPGWWCL